MRTFSSINVRTLISPLCSRAAVALTVVCLMVGSAKANWLKYFPLQKPKTETMVSGGVKIKVDCYEPKNATRAPAIVLVHGIGGPKTQNKLYQIAATLLAQKGYVVLLPHYFDRTGAKFNPRLFDQFKQCVNGAGPQKLPQQMRKDFCAWMSTVKDTISYAQRLQTVDPARVGLMGFSLGGFLAMSVAAQPAVRVSAMVELCGGLPKEMRPLISNLPPTLVIHGKEDKVVPVRQAEMLRDLANDHRLPITVEIIPNVGHGLVDKGVVAAKPGEKQPGLDPKVIMKVAGLTMKFLDHHLAARVAAK